MDDKNIQIKSQQPACTGGLKLLHSPIRTYGKANKKNGNSNFLLIMVKMCFQCS